MRASSSTADQCMRFKAQPAPQPEGRELEHGVHTAIKLRASPAEAYAFARIIGQPDQHLHILAPPVVLPYAATVSLHQPPGAQEGLQSHDDLARQRGVHDIGVEGRRSLPGAPLIVRRARQRRKRLLHMDESTTSHPMGHCSSLGALHIVLWVSVGRLFGSVEMGGCLGVLKWQVVWEVVLLFGSVEIHNAPKHSLLM